MATIFKVYNRFIAVTILLFSAIYVDALKAADKANYTTIDSRGKQQFEQDVVEFFSFACPFCYKMEPSVEMLLEEGISVHRVPIYFGKDSFGPPARAAVLIDKLALPQSFYGDIFNINHQKEYTGNFELKGWLDSTRYQIASLFNPYAVRLVSDENYKDFFVHLGVNQDRLELAYQGILSDERLLTRYDDISRAYDVRTSPTFLIANKYLVQGSDLNGQEFVDLIKTLIDKADNKE